MAEINMQAIDDALELFQSSKEVAADMLKRLCIAAAIRKFGSSRALEAVHYQSWAEYIEGKSNDWPAATLGVFDMQLFCDDKSIPSHVRDKVWELLQAGIKACE